MNISSLSGAGSAVTPNPPEQAPRVAEASPVVVQVPAAVRPEQTAGPSFEQVQQATKQVQQMVQTKTSNLTFSVDQGSGKTVVKLMDNETGKVIRQIPSEEMIAMAEALDKMEGMLLKQKA